MESQHSLYLRDPEAFSAAYRRLAPAALAAAAAVLHDGPAAEDVVQDVFVALWMHPDGWRPERGSLSTYVRLLARSRALDRLRSHAAGLAAIRRGADEASIQPASAEPSSETVIRRDRAQTVLRALETLPEGQRTAVLLHHVGGLSDADVAQATCVPLGTAKSRIRMGTRRVGAAVGAQLAA